MSGESVIKVLNAWDSMFGMRVLIALKEKGVEYEYLEQDLFHKGQLLLQSNPIHKKVPVLIHNGHPICESLIIVRYIDEFWSPADKPLLPCDPYQRAMALFWADYIDKKVYNAGMRIIRSPEGDQREQAKKDMKECLEKLDGALRDMCGGGQYFGGQKIGLVDLALAPFLCWFEAYETLGEFKLMEEGECPHLSGWAKGVVEYPSVKEAMSIAPFGEVVEFAYMFRKMALGSLKQESTTFKEVN